MTRWQVVAPGRLSTVQDLGRTGWRHLGVAQAGALDTGAAVLANQLVGNEANAAVLELTLQGPVLRLPRGARVALTGASMAASWNGIALPGQRPLSLPAGELVLGRMREGIRAWLAVEGGFEVPTVMGSRSTDLRGGFGGHEGRALRAGDTLVVGGETAAGPTQPVIADWWIGPDAPSGVVRFVASDHPAALQLTTQSWQVSAHGNRQGLRLHGQALHPAAASGLSAPVAIGTVQLPADGQPIVLLSDAQTVGGYARLGHVIAADLPRLAQAAPHSRLRFQPVAIDEAREIGRRWRAQQARTALAIRQRLSAVAKPA